MDRVISQIVNIEKRAREITEDARKQYANIDEIIESEISELRNNLYNKANQRIDKNQKSEEEYCKKTILKLEKQKEKIINDLNNSNNEKKSDWADMILKNIINSIGG